MLKLFFGYLNLLNRLHVFFPWYPKVPKLYPKLVRFFDKFHGIFCTLVAHAFPYASWGFPKLPMFFHRHFGIFTKLIKFFNMFEFFPSYYGFFTRCLDFFLR